MTGGLGLGCGSSVVRNLVCDPSSQRPAGRSERLSVSYAWLRPSSWLSMNNGSRRGHHGPAARRRGRPRAALLTDMRPCLLVHYAFRRDRGLEFFAGHLAGVRRINLIGPVWYLRLNYRIAEAGL
jgi:hypothetical protein